MFQQLFLFLDHALDDLDHAFHIRDYLTRPKANDFKIAALKPRSSSLVMRHLLGFEMLIAIDFDDEPDWQTNEISKVRPQWKLATKAMAANRLSSQMPP